MERSRCVDMKEHIGERFGRLVIVGVARDERRKRYHAVCKCDCGGEKVCQYIHLKKGKTKSCGCIERERVESERVRNEERRRRWEATLARYEMAREERRRAREEKERDAAEYRMFVKDNIRLYHCWQSMLRRCYWSKHPNYKNYGGRGVRVCEMWRHDFRAFASWALSNGYAEGLAIDRIDDNGNYEPTNCRFVTCVENNNNKRNNLWLKDKDGNVKTCAEWARLRGISHDTMRKSWMAKGYARVEYGS